jgi:sugar O-acyltransferase (sialic acid O-acetyltransferase NeuD family)
MITKSTLEDMDITESQFEVTESVFDPNAVVIYGGGGHGKTVIEMVRALGTYQIIGVIDDSMEEGGSILGVPILGNADALVKLYDQGIRLAVNAVGGIGNLPVRVIVFERITKAGFVCPAVVHPAAFIEPSAKISAGSQIFPHAYVGSDTRVGFGSIINTGAIISHDCILEDHVNISPGAILAGEVRVGTRVLIGMGVTINLGVQIGANTRIGNGATVKRDVPPKSIVPAGGTWPE